jgi:hypothetical protein
LNITKYLSSGRNRQKLTEYMSKKNLNYQILNYESYLLSSITNYISIRMLNNKLKKKMKKNKISLLLVCSALTLCFLSTEPSIAQSKSLKQEELIVGEWFPLNTSKGGLGTAYTFNEDGTFITAMGAYVVFNYKLEKDSLISIIPGEKEIKQKIEIKSTKMILGSNGQNMEFTRIGGDNNAGIIGKWTGNHYTGSKQIIDFTSSQKEFFSLPMQTKNGTYEIKSDLIELLGDVKGTYQWSVVGDSLTLKSTNDEKFYSYVRIK